MEPQMNTDPCLSVLLTRKSFAGRKGFFFAKSWRSSRLRGESWAGLSPRRREARAENAKDFSLVAGRAVFICGFVHTLGCGFATPCSFVFHSLLQSASCNSSNSWPVFP